MKKEVRIVKEMVIVKPEGNGYVLVKLTKHESGYCYYQEAHKEKKDAEWEVSSKKRISKDDANAYVRMFSEDGKSRLLRSKTA